MTIITMTPGRPVRWITVFCLLFSAIGCGKNTEQTKPAAEPAVTSTPVVNEVKAPETAATATPQATPTPEAKKVEPVAVPEAGLTAADLLKNASFANADWPGTPEWKYIKPDITNMTMAPRNPYEPDVTTLRVPLKSGNYKLVGGARLFEKATGPVVLVISQKSGSGSQELLKKDIAPNASINIDQPVKIEKDGDELELILKVAPDVPNNWSSTLYFHDFKLVPESAVQPKPASETPSATPAPTANEAGKVMKDEPVTAQATPTPQATPETAKTQKKAKDQKNKTKKAKRTADQ